MDKIALPELAGKRVFLNMAPSKTRDTVHSWIMSRGGTIATAESDDALPPCEVIVFYSRDSLI